MSEWGSSKRKNAIEDSNKQGGSYGRRCWGGRGTFESKRSLAWRAHLLFLLVGAYGVISPLSMASSLPIDAAVLKYLRVAVLAGAAFTGISYFEWPSKGSCSKAVLVFSFLYFLGAVWSSEPFTGMFYKGMFLVSVVLGMCIAECVSDMNTFRALQRYIGIFYIPFLAVCLWAWQVGEGEMIGGRLRLLGMNANFLGQTTAIGSLFCLGICVLERGVIRNLGVVGLITLCGLTVATGSRAAVLVILGGIGLLLFLRVAGNSEYVIKTAYISSTCAALFAITWIAMDVDPEADRYYSADTVWVEGDIFLGDGSGPSLRLLEDTFRNNRAKVWSLALSEIAKRPFFGWGWKNYRGRWALYQSSILQVVIELGTIGIFLLLWVFWRVTATIFELASRQGVRSDPDREWQMSCAVGLLLLFLHGAFENALLVGTTANSVLMGFFSRGLDGERMQKSVKYRRQTVIRKVRNGAFNRVSV